MAETKDEMAEKWPLDRVWVNRTPEHVEPGKPFELFALEEAFYDDTGGGPVVVYVPEARLAAVEAEYREAFDRLAKFTLHGFGCARRTVGPPPAHIAPACDCGLDEAIAALPGGENLPATGKD